MAVRSLRYNTFEGRNWKGATFVTDADALAFCEAAQIYDRNQQKAIVDLVRRLKTAGLWTKMKVIYPFVGGTASSHKFNLKDPRDTSAAFRLSFFGGWTHSSTGALPNGTTGYGNSNLLPSATLTGNNIHISFYSRTSTASTGDAWGADQNRTPGEYLRMRIRYTSGANVNQGHTIISAPGTIGQTIVTNTDGLGHYIANAPNSTTRQFIKNGTAVTPDSQVAIVGNGLVNRAMYLSAINSVAGLYGYDNKECAFATIGDGLTDAEATALYNIVDLYQKRLDRAV